MKSLSCSMLTLAAAGALLVTAGWRWHSAAVAMPDHIGSVDRPSAVLLVQERDCPDRRAAMARWLETMRATQAGSGLPVSLAVIRGDAGGLDPVLGSLPRLDGEGVARAARAVRRAGIPGTPALILLDDEGRVLLTDTFAPTGESGPRLALAATLLPEIHPSSDSDGFGELDGR